MSTQKRTSIVKLPSGNDATIDYSTSIPTIITQFGERNATALERALLSMLGLLPDTRKPVDDRLVA